MINLLTVSIKDFGPFHNASVDLCKRGLVLVKGVNNDSTSADSNGSGKTHIFKAICWCLFGETVEGDRGKEVIRQGAATAIVEITFTVGSTMYVLKRARSNGPSLTLTRDGHDISGPIVKETQELINKVLGTDFQTFHNTVYYGQEDGNRFGDIRTTDTERKTVLKRILRMDVLDSALVQAKENAKVGAQVLDGVRQRLTETQNKLAYAREVEQSHQPEHARLAERAADLEQRMLQKDKWQETKVRLLEVLDEGQGAKLAVSGLRNKLEAAVRLVSRQEVVVGQHKAYLDALARQAGKYTSGCPTCGAKANQPHIVKHRAEAAAAVDAKRAELDVANVTLGELAEAAELARAALSEGEEIAGSYGQYQVALNNVNARLDAIRVAEAQLTEVKSALKRRRAEYTTLEQQIATLLTTETKLLSDVQEGERAVQHFDFWVKGFGNQGMASYLMSEALPELTNRTNHYLSILSDGDITVDMEAESQLKTGEVRDKLALSLVIEGQHGVRPSTGQLKKITIASDLALMELMAMRGNDVFDIIMLDEVMDNLDAAGKSRVVMLLEELRLTKGTILVISHDPGLAELFETVITVTKEKGVASIG